MDEQIIELLGKRFGVCGDVARYKARHNLPMMQPARVEAVKERCAALARDHGVDGDFARRLYSLIIGEACWLEDQIMEQLGVDVPEA